jgi:Phage tail tube protein
MTQYNLQMFALDQNKIMNAKEGKVYITENGKVREFATISEIEPKVETKKMSYFVLGNRMEQHKAVGLTGSASCKVYMIDNVFRRAVTSYKKWGAMPKIDIQCINNDPTVPGGRITVNYTGVIFNEALMNSVKADSEDAIVTETDFTFNDYNIIEDTK